MSRESADNKSRRYLAEGRVTVREATRTGVVAEVVGDSGLRYRVEFGPEVGGWWCNCPGGHGECAHIPAAQFVTDVDRRSPA